MIFAEQFIFSNLFLHISFQMCLFCKIGLFLLSSYKFTLETSSISNPLNCSTQPLTVLQVYYLCGENLYH